MTDQQNVSGGVGYQVNKPQTPVILGNDNEININYSQRPNLGAPFQAPPLPQHYVERPEHFNAVKAMLLDGSTPGTLVISAIYGMGGIGKSVLAAALVQNSEIQQRFPDGVLWVTLGQQPDMLSMVNLWIRELGDYDYNPTTLAAASLHLRTLLADKRALLVVDDMWNPEHVEPFRIGGAGCCVLVTTRQTKIVGATRYDLDLMTPQQSLELLTQCLSKPLSDTEQSFAETFAKEVGYLPLALELAAAQIEDGVTWDELLEAFQSEMADPEALDIDSDVESLSDEAIQKRRSLVASFKLTLKLLSSKQLEHFAWFGIVPEDVSLTQEMAATLWGVKSLKAGKLLREFKNRALLLPQAQRSGEKPTYRIHDLMHDVAKHLLTSEQYLGDLPGLGLTVEEAHSQFLERYRVQTQDDLWHTVPADGYIHRHLLWHFEQSGQLELMHELLKESTPEGRNGWYNVCEQLGQTVTFVTDVARAWQAAEELYGQNATESIALQSRYALITTSLNSLAQNIPTQLIAVFVQKGFWTPAQGLAYVRRAQQTFRRADGLIKLVPHLPEALMGEALAVARLIQYEPSRAVALRGLAPYVPEGVSEALETVRLIQYEFDQAAALNKLVPYVPESLMSKALDTARTIQDEYARAKALSGLAPYVPEVVGEALETVRLIQYEFDQAAALNELVPYVPESLMSEALGVARSIQDESARADALSGLAPYVPEVVSEALRVARTIQSEPSRAVALRGLAPYVSEVVSEALRATGTIQDESLRAHVLSGLAQYVPELMSNALRVARSIQDEYARTRALSELAQYVPEVVSEALGVARLIQNESARADALSRLAPYVPDELMSKALGVAVARSIQDESVQARALSELAQYVPEVVSEALRVARLIQNESARADALSGLAQYVPDDLMSEALGVAFSLRHESAQAQALSELAQYLPGELMSKALGVASLIQDESYRTYALSGLAQYVPELMSEALEVAFSIQDESVQAQVLSRLAQYVPDDLMSEALALARSIQDESAQAQALSGLAQYVPDDLMSEALGVARSIQNGYDRVMALGELAKYVPEVVGEALGVARSIQDESAQAQALSELAQYVPDDLMSEALGMVHSIQYERSRFLALRELAPYVPESLISEALEVVRRIQDESYRAESLRELAQYVPDDLMSEALALARSIQNVYLRARALSGLARYVPEVVSEALEVVRRIQDESARAKALSRLVPKLKKIEIEITLWKEVVHTLAYQSRQSFLADLPNLAPAMIALSGEDKTVLNLVVDAMRDVCRQWP